MASRHAPHSLFRQRAGDGFFVAGCFLFAFAFWPPDPLVTAVLIFSGALMIFVSHLFYPFRDRSARFRAIPLRHIGFAPPSPDTSVRFRHVDEEEIECLYSPQQEYRVGITRDQVGRYRVRRERWNTSDWDVAAVAFWSDDDARVTITDTLENARKLAAERLSETPDASRQDAI